MLRGCSPGAAATSGVRFSPSYRRQKADGFLPGRDTASRMHEMGVAMEICRIAERSAAGHPERITRVGVVVGGNSGIEPSSLEFWLESMFTNPPFSGAMVSILAEPGDALRVDYLEVDDDRPSD